MSRKKITTIILVMVVIISATLTIGLLNKSLLLQVARPWIADNIITIQNVRKMSDIVFLPQIVLSEDRLPHFDLRLSGRDIEKLNSALPQGDYTAIEAAGLVFNALEGDAKKRVNAKILYEGKEYDVRVGYRGVSYNHWYFPKKSWAVEFKKESPIGIQSIDLIIPEDRGYLNEELNHYRARKLGLIVPESGFVNLTVNGSSHGVYWLVEDWSKEMLVKNGKSLSGCIFGARPTGQNIGEEVFWKEYTGNCNDEDLVLGKFLGLTRISDADFIQEAPKVLNIEQVLRWEVATRLAGSSDTTHGYNERIYFDDITGKFELLPWDVSIETLGERMDVPYDELITRLLSVEENIKRRNEILKEYLDGNNLEDDLAFYDALFDKTKIAFYRDRLKNESNLEFNEKVAANKAIIQGNAANIKSALGIAGAARSAPPAAAPANFSGLPAEALAKAGARFENENVLAMPIESVEAVWDYLKNDYGSGDGALATRVETEEFSDIYFDTPSLVMLGKNAGIRFRTRSRDDKDPLVQIKASGVGDDVLSRGEWKFGARKTPDTTERHPLLRRITGGDRDEFTETAAAFGAEARVLKPILELAQERRRIYFSSHGKDVFTISLDLSSTERWWAKAQFASIDVEINEVAYTAASEAERAELRAEAKKIAADITAQFPSTTPDRAPKYNKAFSALAAKIPLYKFLIGVGIL